jgi:hypothetical protein
MSRVIDHEYQHALARLQRFAAPAACAHASGLRPDDPPAIEAFMRGVHATERLI